MEKIRRCGSFVVEVSADNRKVSIYNRANLSQVGKYNFEPAKSGQSVRSLARKGFTLESRSLFRVASSRINRVDAWYQERRLESAAFGRRSVRESSVITRLIGRREMRRRRSSCRPQLVTEQARKGAFLIYSYS